MFTLELKDPAKTVIIETDIRLDLLAERVRLLYGSHAGSPH